MSFTPNGRPCSGPRKAPASRRFACSSASSGSRNSQACTLASRASIRSRQARVRDSLLMALSAMAVAASQAVSSFSGFIVLPSRFDVTT